MTTSLPSTLPVLAAGSPCSRRRVFVVEDHALMRKSIIAAFEREQHLAVCGQAEDVSEAYAGIIALEPDLVLTDIALKSSSGLELIAALHASAPQLPVIAISMFNVLTNERLALSAGATGFVSKQDGPERLLQVVNQALQSRQTSHPASSPWSRVVKRPDLSG